MKCVAYINAGGYMYQYVYYDEYTKQFYSKCYHYGKVDDAEEFCNGIKKLTYVQALKKCIQKLKNCCNITSKSRCANIIW